jgi:hypothetical protein
MSSTRWRGKADNGAGPLDQSPAAIALVAAAITIGANPAMAVWAWSDDDAGNGSNNNAGSGRDDDSAVHGMTMSVDSAGKSRPATHRDSSDACRRVGEWGDRHCRGGNGGQPRQRDR